MTEAIDDGAARRDAIDVVLRHGVRIDGEWPDTEASRDAAAALLVLGVSQAEIDEARRWRDEENERAVREVFET